MRGDFPWLVPIFITKDNGLKFICGGTLISDSIVLSAAHCVKSEESVNPKDLILILGKHNLNSWIEEGTEIVGSKAIITHPDFNHESINFDADLTLIALSRPVHFTEYIQPACLWNESLNQNDLVGMNGTIAGWGKTLSASVSKVPLKLEVPIVSETTCLRSDPAFQFMVSNRTFCAGKRNGQGACNGDSGSGLMIQQDSRWYLRGVVSTSLLDHQTRSCDLSKYVVFTDVSKFYDWIKHQTSIML